jgi:predicted RecB family nuclease
VKRTTPDPDTAPRESTGIAEPPPDGRIQAGTSEQLGSSVRLTSPGRLHPWLASPQLPPWPVVWLVIEGDPGGGQVHHAIHLWGLAVDDGKGEPRCEAIVAGFEDQDGRHTWERFVARAGEIIECYPGARWVHYSPDESASVRACAARHGAPPGFLERLEEAFFELLSRGVRRTLRLPLDSCSLRQVAGLADFRWRSPRPGPAGTISQYQKARTSTDPAECARILQEIVDSNAEDLRAMRAVWRWMIKQGPREYCG